MRAWLVIALLLAVLASPLFTQPEVLEDVEANVNYSTPLQTTVSPSTAGLLVVKKLSSLGRIPRPSGQERHRRRADPPMGTDYGGLQR